MFELSVQAEFSAAHAILLQGQREIVHGHNWHVTATITGSQLDHEGLLCDFHLVERALGEVIGPYHNNDLNRLPPFVDVNPTAENVARHIADALAARLDPQLAPNAGVASVRVTEAPGCAITYWTPWGRKSRVQ
ncbi:MAG TPA: 6-carboxytetrahydropterin synthase [Phycisphaerales bacterium]|nr:6-carboxytetrahydropterin synthase [Phycisphaerales bacterium]